MIKNFVLLFFLFSSLISVSQCSSHSISVSSSDTSYIQLYHAGFFIIPSGFANQCEGEITTFAG